LYGIIQGLHRERSGKIASALASIKNEHRSGQNHRPSIGEGFAQYRVR